MSDRQNDFSQGSIPRNIMNLALPMMAAQLVNVLYSVVDLIYLGHLPDRDSLALTGLGVTMPIVSILMGFANLCGTLFVMISLGLSGFFVSMTNSLVQVVRNATLQACGGDLYVGVMTIINSVREVFIMPAQGLANGSQPVGGLACFTTMCFSVYRPLGRMKDGAAA